MMKRNIRIFAENSGNGFNIYIEFSGQREYLMFHRHNALLYDILKDGITVNDIRRWKPSMFCRKKLRRKSVSEKLYNMLKHLLLVIDDYLIEREEACWLYHFWLIKVFKKYAFMLQNIILTRKNLKSPMSTTFENVSKYFKH